MGSIISPCTENAPSKIANNKIFTHSSNLTSSKKANIKCVFKDVPMTGKHWSALMLAVLYCNTKAARLRASPYLPDRIGKRLDYLFMSCGHHTLSIDLNNAMSDPYSTSLSNSTSHEAADLQWQIKRKRNQSLNVTIVSVFPSFSCVAYNSRLLI